MTHSPSIDRAKPMRQPEHVLCRLAGGEAVLLNTTSELYYGLDGVGTAFWRCVEQGMTFDDAVQALLTQYVVEAAQLEGDLLSLLARLTEADLLVIGA